MVGLNLVIMVALAAVAVIVLSMWLDSYTRHDQKIHVPDLQGVLSTEAVDYLENAGLKALVIDSVYVDARPGAVIEQLPAAGLPVKQGRTIYLTINAYGVRMVKMQNVLSGGSRQALSTLRSLGFVVDSVRQVASENDDEVLSVTMRGEEVEPGREYPLGSHLVVHVGCRNLEIPAENEESEEAWLE